MLSGRARSWFCRQQQFGGGFDFGVKFALPRLQPLAVQQMQMAVGHGGRDGEIVVAQFLHEPGLQFGHGDFLRAKFLQQPLADDGVVKKREISL